jgi:hypothetical protein
MKRQIALTVALALTGCLATSAFAKTNPVYPATEDTPSEEVISSAPGYNGQTPAAPTSVQVQNTAPTQMAAPAQVQAKVKVQAKAQTQPQAQAPSDPMRYDSVPNNQAEPLLRRLRLVEELIAKYGRAYDYRELTVPQLQDILSQLDNKAAESSKLHERMNAREELKKELETEPARAQAPAATDRMEDIPAPAPELNNSIGSAAPEAQGPVQGAESLPPIPN